MFAETPPSARRDTVPFPQQQQGHGRASGELVLARAVTGSSSLSPAPQNPTKWPYTATGIRSQPPRSEVPVLPANPLIPGSTGTAAEGLKTALDWGRLWHDRGARPRDRGRSIPRGVTREAGCVLCLRFRVERGPRRWSQVQRPAAPSPFSPKEPCWPECRELPLWELVCCSDALPR